MAFAFAIDKQRGFVQSTFLNIKPKAKYVGILCCCLLVVILSKCFLVITYSSVICSCFPSEGQLSSCCLLKITHHR